ncbi:STAS domain-containing protein [Verminephrobacter aporrectodeae]|uniref:STAS domain-containing protein n=1 Tax=Verminephrobacter aporrectodeae TaxID=1110389 RepID=UPI0002377AC1|nr:STAS domain-containing protein [Verminephrobacter aporrectodeae]MCW5223241.1 STAS domain-containing protein [Verminephrobacter aporrectodeae subsp. tuberculatae]MCW5288705.1 STAS domain-containing protein [Verminephrobacter aporrectodeae subsp. tuberculatae]MCW8175606.1 STAS domain-containing protein [Verminephrobacter aporrectodeae subsp. tuberculatae]MCW8200214.1 STAS domain-containing protein [Verminephrobacter aporrectodeae subsp. tuberculatae]MCW8203161.1 STAS domain-containing protein
MLVLPSELTQRQATACLRELMQGLRAEQAPAVVVDATATAVFDSAALAVLLECRRAVLAQGRTFAVQGMPAALAGMAGLYGVDSLLAAAG